MLAGCFQGPASHCCGTWSTWRTEPWPCAGLLDSGFTPAFLLTPWEGINKIVNNDNEWDNGMRKALSTWAILDPSSHLLIARCEECCLQAWLVPYTGMEFLPHLEKNWCWLMSGKEWGCTGHLSGWRIYMVLTFILFRTRPNKICPTNTIWPTLHQNNREWNESRLKKTNIFQGRVIEPCLFWVTFVGLFVVVAFFKILA